MKLKQAELKAYRDKKLLEQGGVDPIAGLKIMDPCLDHCHRTGKIRHVLDRRTNAWEGKVVNAFRRCGLQKAGASLPECLQRLASYLSWNYSLHPLHPKHKSPDEKRLARNKKARLKRKKTK